MINLSSSELTDPSYYVVRNAEQEAVYVFISRHLVQ